MLKIIGLLTVFLSCCLVGFYKAAQTRQRSEVLKELLDGMSRLSYYVELSGPEANHIIERCFKKERVFIKNGEIRFNYEQLGVEDITFLKEFFGGFGRQCSAKEAQRCEAFTRQLSKRLEEAQNEGAKLFKLYNTLGVLSGLFFCIFLL